MPKHHVSFSPSMSDEKIKDIINFVNANIDEEVEFIINEPNKFTFTATDIVQRMNISYSRLSQLTNGRVKYKEGTKEPDKIERPFLVNGEDYIRVISEEKKSVVYYAESALRKLLERK